MILYYYSDGMWGQGQEQGPQQLSVVTTVWGVTHTTQTAPFNQNPGAPGYTNTTMSTPNYAQQPQGFPGNHMQKSPYNHGPAQAAPYMNRAPAPNYNRPK